MHLRTVIAILFGCSSVAAAPLQTTSEAYGSGAAYVTCVVDGKSERCFLDTGSPLTIFTNSDRFARYSNLGAFRFKSAAAVAQQIETIQIGSIELDAVVFPRVKVGRATFNGAVNTIGIDLLREQPFAIRFKPKPALELNAGPTEQPLKNLAVSNQGLFAIPIALGGNEVRALWDTGVSITSVDEAYIAAHPENFRATDKGGSGLDGAGKPLLLQVYRARKIVISGHAFEDIRVVATDLSVLRENWNKDIQAVIGFNLIRRGNWYFDANNRFWNFHS
jgi:hypothetical protein